MKGLLDLACCTHLSNQLGSSPLILISSFIWTLQLLNLSKTTCLAHTSTLRPCGGQGKFVWRSVLRPRPGARLGEPQHDCHSNHHRQIRTPSVRRSCCGSQTRACSLVCAWNCEPLVPGRERGDTAAALKPYELVRRWAPRSSTVEQSEPYPRPDEFTLVQACLTSSVVQRRGL